MNDLDYGDSIRHSCLTCVLSQLISRTKDVYWIEHNDLSKDEFF